MRRKQFPRSEKKLWMMARICNVTAICSDPSNGISSRKMEHSLFGSIHVYCSNLNNCGLGLLHIGSLTPILKQQLSLLDYCRLPLHFLFLLISATLLLFATFVIRDYLASVAPLFAFFVWVEWFVVCPAAVWWAELPGGSFIFVGIFFIGLQWVINILACRQAPDL